MGLGYDLYGRQSGYTQKQWDALPQSKKDDIKRFIIGLGSPMAMGAVVGAGGGGGSIAAPIAAGAVAAQPGFYPREESTYDDGGYGYDGGGGGGGGYLPPKKLAESPEWLAYLNALGLEENQFRADIDRQRAFAKSAADMQIGQLGQQYGIQRSQIGMGHGGRGTSKSGWANVDQAQSRASQGRDVSNVNLGLGTTLNQLESSLANKLMDLGARRAQQELSMRASGAYV